MKNRTHQFVDTQLGRVKLEHVFLLVQGFNSELDEEIK